MSDRRRQPSERGHAFFRGHFLLQPAQIREVLKIEDKPTALLRPQAQGGHADTEVAGLTVGSPKVDLFPERKPLHVGILPGQPEILVQLLQFFTAHVGKPVPQNVLPGAVEQQNYAVKIRSNQAAAHGVNDVLREILKAEKFFALFLEFTAFAAE